MAAKNREPYHPGYYPPVPTRFTCLMRIFIPWQLIRFFIINFKILKLMIRADSKTKIN